MPKFDTVRRVPFTPEQMFALVADVEKYPQFVPMCESLSVRSRKERDGLTLLQQFGGCEAHLVDKQLQATTSPGMAAYLV